MFNQMLARQTVRETNLSDMQQVFHEIQRLSSQEQQCFEFFVSHQHKSASVAWVALADSDLVTCEPESIVSVARAAADMLAEQSGRLGLVAYYDGQRDQGLAQFRLRRSKDFKGYDLRDLLPALGIRNGGGHEGAIGFRFPRREVPDIQAKAREIVEGVEAALTAPTAPTAPR